MDPEIRIGCSGWCYGHWKDIFYPPETKWKDQLKYYSSVFNTVEVNSTFYQYPKLSSVFDWYYDTPPDFKITLKASSMITHVERFSEDAEPHIKKMYDYAKMLKEKMGCFLFQCPPSFHYKEEHLHNIIKYLDPSYENVVEFRHPSWWNDTVIKMFNDNGIIFSGTDGFKMPHEFYMAKDTLYIRFHGNERYRHKYTTDEIKPWALTLLRMKPKKMWIYYNNDRDGNAPDNAKELKKTINDYLSLKDLPRLLNSSELTIQNESSKPKHKTEIIEEDRSSETKEDTGDDIFWKDFERKFAFTPKKQKLH